MLCHHPNKSCDHRHCDSGNMFLICHVTSGDLEFKGLCDCGKLIGKSVSHYLFMFRGH